ncbi:MAG: aminotransferase class I/II-fold pyridoxal phosphate-dependent enzyme [Acidimicrobiales bacterium]
MIAPGLHGGDGACLAASLGVTPSAVLDLSASLNPVAPDPAEVLTAHLGALGRYPDPAPATEALATAIGVEPGCVLLTNGGSEAIALVAAELGGWTAEPDFGLYPRGPSDGGPRWRSDPHNPTGRLAEPTDAAGVWDEAFYPLATGRWTAGRWTAGGDGPVVVGSLTKVFACPGLRAGYVLSADRDLLDRARRRQTAWSVNGLVAAALPDLLERADLPRWAASIAALRGRLVDVLRAAGLEPEPSDANYVVVRAPGLRDGLGRHSILVRNCANFGLPDHVRIAVPGTDGLARLATALDALATAPRAPRSLGPVDSAPLPRTGGLHAESLR